MKKFAVVFACLLGGLVASFAQDGKLVYENKGYAKVTVFPGQQNFDLVGISDDGRFFYGSSEGGSAFIYDVENNDFKILEDINIGLLRVKDRNNYAATSYTMIDGKRYIIPQEIWSSHLELSVDAVSGDLKTLFGGYYNPGATEGGQSAYNTIRIDAVSGKIIDTLKWPYPQMQTAGYMNRVMGASQDGKIVVGCSSAPFALYNTSPAFWDLEANTSYYAGIGEDKETGTTEGSLASCNNDGSVLCGNIGDDKSPRAYIIEYDKTNRTFKHVAVPLWAGSSGSTAFGVSENGIVVGSEGSRTFVYDRKSGEKYEMVEYLRYLYGLVLPADIVPFNTTSHISDNGRVFAGTGNPNAEVPYLIELGEHQIHAVARAVTARQTRGTSEVTVSWAKPLIGEYTLKGYWVYRDNVKISTEMQPADAVSFTDRNVEEGQHTYAVEAVYTDEVTAEKASAAPIRVTAVGGCLPVQGIYSSILYNRTVTLYWDLPSDKVAASAVAKNAKKPVAKGYKSQSLDVVSAFDLKNSNASSGVRIGDYIYAVAFQSDLVTIFNAETGTLEKTVAVENFKGAYDLTAHGNSIYAVSNDYDVRKLDIDPEDPFNIEMGTFWTAKAGRLTHIAYVENEAGDDYLALGASNNIMFYPVNPLDRNDTLPGSERFNFRAYAVGGSEAHDGKLYVANQASLGGSEVDVFDLATGKKLYTENLAELPQVTAAAGNQGVTVAGITKTELEDGMVMLQCLVQPSAVMATNYLIDMELESWSETTGYNVYRDGEKINDAPVRARRYSDVVYEPGTYEYTIEYVSNTCTSNSSEAGVSEKVVITPIGTCEKPGAVNATEANNQVILTWKRPSNTSALVGFNIYRNHELKGNLVRDERWLDADKLTKDNKYVYKVEAFYNNSCVASDSVTIKPDFQGRTMPPSLLTGSARRNADNTYDVNLSWELPYFEEPMAYGYCSAPAGSLTPSGVSTVFAVVGWDTASVLFFEDMYLVGMEYFIGTTSLTSLDAVVYVDNRIVHQEPLERYQAGENKNTVLFNKAISAKYATELAVGYIASFDPSNLVGNVVVYDAGPGKRAFSDILSFDGRTSTTLAAAGVDANLCINALIVRRRDLEAAAMASDPAAYLQERMIKTEMPWKVASSSMFTDTPKTTSESIKLTGFNVYRDDKKLNNAPLTGFSFRDLDVQPNGDEIFYKVGAQYEGADEQLAEYYIDLREAGMEESEAFGMRIYPNPVGENLHVKGEYRTLFITDLAGKRVGNVMENAETVSMSALQSGVYLLHFTLLDGRNVVVKVIKR